MHRNITKLVHKLIGLYGISTLVSYLMPNPVYTYDLYVVEPVQAKAVVQSSDNWVASVD